MTMYTSNNEEGDRSTVQSFAQSALSLAGSIIGKLSQRAGWLGIKRVYCDICGNELPKVVLVIHTPTLT